MNIKIGFPPNIQQIRQHTNPDQNTIYCYGDTIFNPSGQEIPADILLHEAVHIDQQKKFRHPDFWWQKYLLSPEFRKQEELEAYQKQIKWVKEKVGSKAAEECLEECAENLSKLYNLGINKYQAKTFIRKWKS